MPEYYIGIDLGTTNTTCSVLRRGHVETLMVEGEPICPSVVGFERPDSFLVGRGAKRRMMIDPEHTIVSVKRKMGKLKYRYNQYNTEYTPAQISSLILAKVKEAAEKELGPVKKAVITVPAYFNDDQRAATREAGELAGFEVLRLISEPTAAAVAYGLNQGKDQTIAVYDLGGGTFDISILQVKNNTFTVKAVGGDPHLGGDDFDQALADFVQKEFFKSSRIDLSKGNQLNAELLSARQKLKEECQKKKEELPEAEESTVEIPNFFKGHHLSVRVTRGQFEKMIMGHVDATVSQMKETLKKARLKKDEIDRVILVGGSTAIPLVRKKVAQTIKEPYIADNVMEMVCRGAAIVAAQYMAIHEKGDEGIKEVIKVSNLKELSKGLQEIYPYRLGISIVHLKTRVDDVFSEIVELGTTLPLSRHRNGFTTVHDNQTEVRIPIYRTSEPRQQGLESCKDKNMRFLGEFMLRGVAPAPAGVPQIGVFMDIDDDGILRVRAELEGTGKSANSDEIPLRVDRELDRVEEED